MVVKSLRILSVLATLSGLSGCAFTQWTDHAFLGTPECPPRHANRTWAFVLAAPPAIVGDIITAPIQAVMLASGGDFSIYANENCMEESEHQAMISASH